MLSCLWFILPLSFEVKFLVWNQAVWSVCSIVLVYVICEFFCFQHCISSLILLLSFHHNLTPLPLSDSEFWKQLFRKIIMSRNNKSLKPELCEVVKRVCSEQKEGNPRRQCHWVQARLLAWRGRETREMARWGKGCRELADLEDGRLMSENNHLDQAWMPGSFMCQAWWEARKQNKTTV